MRTFYIFKIKDEYAILTKNNPYHLFKMFSYIYNLDRGEISIGANLFYKLVEKMDKKEVNSNIYKDYKKNYFYTKFKDRHQIHNYYQKEETKLIVHNHFCTLESTLIHPSFLNDLASEKNIFVCDFENKDYFWLEKIAS